jgi:hypothetical protein
MAHNSYTMEHEVQDLILLTVETPTHGCWNYSRNLLLPRGVGSSQAIRSPNSNSNSADVSMQLSTVLHTKPIILD